MNDWGKIMQALFINSLLAPRNYCVILGLVLIGGCGKETPSVPIVQATITEPAQASEIELTDPKARFEAPDVVRLEVAYRFVKGAPRNFYCAEVEFPGTENVGRKFMESWELKDSGVLTSGMVVNASDLTEFTVRITEALLPQDGYSPISNVVTGKIESIGGTGPPTP
jgi:hypothetical protein